MRENNIVPKNYEHFYGLVRKAWSRETSASPELWSPEDAEKGQCAVTAVLFQKMHGGQLLRAIVNGESHYWNRINDEEVDCTLAQFELPTKFENVGERETDYVLGYPETLKRYLKLEENFLRGVVVSEISEL